MDPAAVLDTIRRRDGYAVIKRRITPEESAAIQKLKADGKLAGVRLENDFSRFYPQGRLASHVVGLRRRRQRAPGRRGVHVQRRAGAPAGGHRRGDGLRGPGLSHDRPGHAVRVDKVARAAMETNKPDSLTVLVMDAHTGEMLAYTALPDFDPNEFQKDSPQIDPASLVNSPVTAAYEPGSVFKIFSLSSMLDQHVITPDRPFPRLWLLREEAPERGNHPHPRHRGARRPHAPADHRVLQQRRGRLCLGEDRQRQPLPHAHALRVRQADRRAPAG